MDIARQIHIYYGGQRFVHPATDYPITIGGILPHSNRVNGLTADQMMQLTTAPIPMNSRDIGHSGNHCEQESSKSDVFESQEDVQQEITPSMCLIQ